ncbi:MAG: 4Fe-4S dicluster domain-containing protein [Burkholderiales bacterium]|nr:4Fe-4S dicluster domain-containing protein [Burkholderiales bacterium]
METRIRWAVAVDLKRCVGCQSCTVACKVEHGTPPGIFWTRVIEMEEGTYPAAFTVFMPLRCNHCSDPPCVPVCPTGATYVRDRDNIVLVDQDKCVGCHACVVACPYDARFIPESDRGYFAGHKTPYEEATFKKWQVGTVQKCTLCVHRLDQGRMPACVETCPTQALIFGDRNDPESTFSKAIRDRPRFQPHAELGTDPNVFYLT